MAQRLDMKRHIAGFYGAMVKLEQEVHKGSLDEALIDLIKLRCSQINHCAFCVNMHTEEALQHGVSQRKIYLLTVWPESHLYSERERAALAWAESVTLVAETEIPDEDYEAVRKVFSEQEVSELTAVICAINVWNRLSVSARSPHAD